MLKRYHQFLTFIIDNLIEHFKSAKGNSAKEEIFQIYFQFRQIAKVSKVLIRTMRHWVNAIGHGSLWSSITLLIKDIDRITNLLSGDINELIHKQGDDLNRILRGKLRGGPVSGKFDMLDRWLGILNYNCGKGFCTWESNHNPRTEVRIIQIPAGSLLNPYMENVTIESKQLRDYWYYGEVDIRLFQSPDWKETNEKGLVYAPIPAKKPTQSFMKIWSTDYPIQIELPRQSSKLFNLIDEIEKDVEKFCTAVNNLYEALMDANQSQSSEYLPPV